MQRTRRINTFNSRKNYFFTKKILQLGSSNFNSLLVGEIILAFTGVILFWSIVVLIAQFRLARKYTSFWLLFGQVNLL
jgi:hypothetical protein